MQISGSQPDHPVKVTEYRRQGVNLPCLTIKKVFFDKMNEIRLTEELEYLS